MCRGRGVRAFYFMVMTRGRGQTASKGIAQCVRQRLKIERRVVVGVCANCHPRTAPLMGSRRSPPRPPPLDLSDEGLRPAADSRSLNIPLHPANVSPTPFAVRVKWEAQRRKSAGDLQQGSSEGDLLVASLGGESPSSLAAPSAASIAMRLAAAEERRNEFLSWVAAGIRGRRRKGEGGPGLVSPQVTLTARVATAPDGAPARRIKEGEREGQRGAQRAARGEGKRRG